MPAATGGWVFSELLQDLDGGIRVAGAKLFARGIQVVAGRGSRDGGQEQAD
jgi:hypothetical protein